MSSIGNWRHNLYVRILVLLWFGVAAQILHGAAAEPPVAAVEDWYKILGDASGAEAQYGGTVAGGTAGLSQAYQRLAPSLRSSLTEAVFDRRYARIAHVTLLQAHLVRMDIANHAATVFVEEERTVVLEKIPAVAWYAGEVRLMESAGEWKISGFDLAVEDIISLAYGGHMPYRSDPNEVSRVAVGQDTHLCSEGKSKIEQNAATVYVCNPLKHTVRLVQLHSGEWRTIGIEPPVKPRK